jgi:hypothetical protein
MNLRSNAALEETQLGVWNRKQRKAATEAYRKLGEYPDHGLVKAFPTGEMDVHLRAKLCLYFRPTGTASHNHFLLTPDSVRFMRF